MKSVFVVASLIAFINPLFAESFHYENNGLHLRLEINADHIVHGEYTKIPVGDTIYSSPMVQGQPIGLNYLNVNNSNEIETSRILVRVDPNSLCMQLHDVQKNEYVTTLCPNNFDQPLKNISIDDSRMQNAYGLGEKFKQPGNADGDLLYYGVRDSGKMGNGFQTFELGAVGDIQIPILYGVGENVTFGLFLDNVYKQTWDFSRSWWNAYAYGDQMRFFYIAGNDLKEVRSNYLEITGTSPVPPKKTFGLWMSKFGYHNWNEIDNTRDAMRSRHIPFDGFVLDINWFGSIDLDHPENSRMGFLEWDQSDWDGNDNYFPNPEERIKAYDQENINFVAIEESYVVNTSDTFKNMAQNKMFAYSRDYNGRCNPNGEKNPIELHAWWGNGSMIDWSNEATGRWFHDNKRFENLTKVGITSHWTDLGEPEMYRADACYAGSEFGKNEHSDYHNLHNLLWNKSIWEGYARHNEEVNKRPFIMTRSGAAGTQRFGAGVWSADIAARLSSLAAHMNAQLHMSMSGIDYYSSDIGGFRKETLPGNDKAGSYRGYEGETYTMWLANGAWFDVPVRPHTDNDFSVAYAPIPNLRPYETAPYLVGDEYSNKMNILQRYELIPYYYSLAYRAHLYGEAVFPPLVYHYQDDLRLRNVGHQKMIGENLMVGIAASHGEIMRNVVLPKDEWFNYHTNEYFNGRVQGEVKNVPIYRDGVLRLPVFARAGSIIPMMNVTNETLDAFNHRANGSTDNTLVVKAYEGPASNFVLYEDDGKTLKFTEDFRPIYNTQTTELHQYSDNNHMSLTVSSAEGENLGFNSRDMIFKLVTKRNDITAVNIDGSYLKRVNNQRDLDYVNDGWFFDQNKREVTVKTANRSIYQKLTVNALFGQELETNTEVMFACHNGWTTSGERIAVVINDDFANPIALDPSVYYEYIWNPAPNSYELPGPKSPIWTGIIKVFNSDEQINATCVKVNERGEIVERSNVSAAAHAYDRAVQSYL